jgi:hypothetical protein
MAQKHLETKPKSGRTGLKQKRHRRIVVAFLLPAIIFCWAIGWGLYWIGSRSQKSPKKSTARDSILHPIQILQVKKYE